MKGAGKRKIKVAVGMSGGVDSSVAAALLVQQGYDVVGFHLHFWSEEAYSGAKRIENKCCSVEALETARKIAHQLKIPFYVIDYSKQFKKNVVDYFLEEYRNLRTPNPCVVCNKFIKFGHFLDQAQKLGCDFVATGHYARVECENAEVGNRTRLRANDPPKNRGASPSGSGPAYAGPPELACARQNPSSHSRYRLLVGIDQRKDQSYFLYTLTQKQLTHILFPVGGFLKSEVRMLAKDFGLPVYNKPESFEICFVNDTDYRGFLQRHVSEVIKPGEVVNTGGRVIGKHEGLPLYTIGQRRGFLVETKTPANAPLYVIGFNQKENQLIVGRGKESERKEFVVENLNWIAGRVPKLPMECMVRIRHQGELLNAKCKTQPFDFAQGENAKLIVELEEAQRGVTPGQSAVFYRDDEVLGGGIIGS